MNNLIIKIAIALSLVIVFISCSKEENKEQLTQENYHVGDYHNKICSEVITSINQNRSLNNEVTIEGLDSIFLLLYPEMTQEILDETKNIMVAVENKRIIDVFDSSYSSKADYTDSRVYAVKMDSIFYTLENNDKATVINNLQNLISNISSSEILTEVTKYKLITTTDVAIHSIELWSGTESRSTNADPWSIMRAFSADAKTYNAIMAEAAGMGISSYAQGPAARASAYASLGAYFNVKLDYVEYF